MVIKNLAQLKRAIEARTPFLIVEHYVHPETVGQIRVPNVVQTNGFYSVVRDEPNNPINLYNNHKGSWMAYGKASEWMFEGDTVTAVSTRRVWIPDAELPPFYDYVDEKVMTIRFLDKGEYENV